MLQEPIINNNVLSLFQPNILAAIVVNVREHMFTRTFEPLWKYDTEEIFAVSLYQLSIIFECIYCI